MRLSIVGYNAFKAVTTSLGTPTHVYYCQDSGQVFKAVSILNSDKDAVVGDLTTGGIDVTTFLVQYPSAIEVPFSIEVT